MPLLRLILHWAEPIEMSVELNPLSSQGYNCNVLIHEGSKNRSKRCTTSWVLAGLHVTLHQMHVQMHTSFLFLVQHNTKLICKIND